MGRSSQRKINVVKLAALVTDQMDDGKKILTTLGSSSHEMPLMVIWRLKVMVGWG